MIEISKKNDQEFYIKFSGSNMPDYLEYMSLLREAGTKYFDPEVLCWVCDSISAQKIQDALNNTSIGGGLKLKPYGYQRQAITFCLEHPNALIKLPCGAGKTPIGIGIFYELKHNKLLKSPGIFVVKASLKTQWLSEVAKFSNFKASIIHTYKSYTAKYNARLKKREKNLEKLIVDSATKNADKVIAEKEKISELKEEREQYFKSMFDDSDIFIVNYETLNDEKVRTELLNIAHQFFYVDEIDCIKDSKTLRSKALCLFNNAKFKYGATATPIRKNPEDLYGIFHFLKQDLFPKKGLFQQRYLKMYFGRVSGSKNEEELTSIINPYIFTRTFEEIADQLPKQIVIQRTCAFTSKQLNMNQSIMDEIEELKDQEKSLCLRFTPQQLQYNADYKQIEDSIVARQTFAQMLADSEELLLNSDSNMAKRYVTGSASAKVELCMDLVQKILNSGEKVCIFSKYIGMQDILEREIKRSSEIDDNIKIARIDGGTSAVRRKELLDLYNNNDDYGVLLISDSGEAGLNLSTTKYMIEFELAESAAKQTQRHGRIQRADSVHKNVFVYQLVCLESYDEIAQKIISKKQRYNTEILN